MCSFYYDNISERSCVIRTAKLFKSSNQVVPHPQEWGTSTNTCFQIWNTFLHHIISYEVTKWNKGSFFTNWQSFFDRISKTIIFVSNEFLWNIRMLIILELTDEIITLRVDKLNIYRLFFIAWFVYS